MTRPAIHDDRACTDADDRRFPEDERWNIIDGVVTVQRDGRNGRYQTEGQVSELAGMLDVSAVPGLVIDWSRWQPLPDDRR